MGRFLPPDPPGKKIKTKTFHISEIQPQKKLLSKMTSLPFSCYVTLSAQCLSADGTYLCIGHGSSTSGCSSNKLLIGIYKVLDLLEHRVQDHTHFSLPGAASKSPITALATTQEELIVGTLLQKL